MCKIIRVNVSVGRYKWRGITCNTLGKVYRQSACQLVVATVSSKTLYAGIQPDVSE